MAYEVLARKWRPQQFSDVVGQDHITQTLKNAIKTNRVAHAYLFVGPRGIGKTTLARILAKALNCQEKITETPCDHCVSCREIVTGSSLDVMEIDGASNRGIDDVRALRDTIQYRPNGRFKVIIIDEVHQVTSDAFNALLKTLEEPPDYVKFIFATTEPQKIPATIISRCQRFDLRRIPLKLILERLQLIAQSEKIEIEENALLAIARAAEGGMRDAQSALDQVASYHGRRITEDDVLAIFGMVSQQALSDLMSALLSGDATTLVRLIEAWDQEGRDLQRLLFELLEYCRNLLVYQLTGADAGQLDLTETQLAALKSQAAQTTSEHVLRLVDILTATWDRLRTALSKKIFLETALIRCARAANTVSLSEVIEQVQALKEGLPAAPSSTTPVAPARAHAEPASRPPAAEAKLPPPRLTSASTSTVDELAMLKRNWRAIVERAGNAAPLVKSNLIDATPVAARPDQVQVAFDPEFAHKMEIARHPRNLNALRKALTSELKRNVSVEFVLAEQPCAREESVAEPVSAAPAASAPDVPAQKSTVRGKQKWIMDPAVQKTIDMFGGTITDIKE